jgi:hypothetical protein
MTLALSTTPIEKSTSLLRIPWREGYHQESLFLTQFHKGKLVLTKEIYKWWVIQTITGAPHGEGAQQATPNHLEARFKSNKRESINQSCHKCFLRRRSEETSQRGLILHLKASHTQTLGVIFATSAWKGVGREGSELGRCFNGSGGGTLERRKMGYLYPSPSSLAVMSSLRPGQVNWLPPKPSRVTRSFRPVDPVR